jgi:Flp pilus assembly protein TadD
VLALTVAAGLLGRFLVAGDGGTRPAPPAAAGDSGAVVARLQAELRQRPDEPRLLTRLGVAYLSRARETADPTWYAKAAGVLERASGLAPADPAVLVARGLLELGRHDFRSALAWGTRAARANPDLPDALGVIFDAQVELGRYQAAVVTAQAMVDRKPTQGSLARVA